MTKLKGPIGKPVQIVAWQNLLLALTDLGDVWVLHGYDTGITGGIPQMMRWRKLVVEIDTLDFPAGDPIEIPPGP